MPQRIIIARFRGPALRENITIMYLLISFENFVTSCTTPSYASSVLCAACTRKNNVTLEITSKTYITHVTFNCSIPRLLAFSPYVLFSFLLYLTNHPTRQIIYVYGVYAFSHIIPIINSLIYKIFFSTANAVLLLIS